MHVCGQTYIQTSLLRAVYILLCACLCVDRSNQFPVIVFVVWYVKLHMAFWEKNMHFCEQ